MQRGVVGAQAGDPGALVDAYAEVEAGAAQSPGQLRRVHHGHPVGVEHPTQVRRRVHLGAHLVRVEQPHPVAVPAGQVGVGGQPVELVRLDGDGQLAGALEVAVDVELATVAAMASRFSRPRRSSSPTSSGNRSTPLASPWVSEAAQNPPLRPDAAQPQMPASTSSTSRSGSACFANSAAHSPP